MPLPRTRRCLSVPDVLDGLIALARASRARSQAKFIGVTGSVGKTGTKEALRLALSKERRDACFGRVLQQPLGRAAVARALPRERAVCRARNGHEPCRRDRAADEAGAAACRDRHHHRAGASGVLSLGRGHRRRQGGDLPGDRAGRRGGHQPRQSAFRAAGRAGEGCECRPHRLVRREREGRRAARQVRVAGRIRPPRRRASSATTSPTSSARRAAMWCRTRSRCWPRRRSPAPISRSSAVALAELAPPTGRGARSDARGAGRAGAPDRRELQRQSGLDAGGARAARPGADRSARTAHRGARRDAGARRRRAWNCTAGLRRRSRTIPSTWCFAPVRSIAGFGRLFHPAARAAMPTRPRRSKRRCWARCSAGDAVMIKGSLGSKMGPS